MDKKLLEKATNSPSNLSFKELEKLATGFGWKHRRTRGSHHIFTHPGDDQPRPLNLQHMNGNVNPEQVKEVLRRATAMGLANEGRKNDDPS